MMSKLHWAYYDYQGDAGFPALEDVLRDGSPSGVASQTSFAYVLGNLKVVFDGQFTIYGPGEVSGGTITGFHVYEDDALLLDATGYHMDFDDFDAAVAALADPSDDNWQSLLTLLTSGPVVAVGSSDDDILVGGAHADHLVGKGGSDWFLAGRGNDTLSGGSGNDFILAAGGKDRATGAGGKDAIDGGDGKDKLFGGGGDDGIAGGNGKDLIKGGPGNDMLEGGRGNDVLFGGSGNDSFFFQLSPGAVGVDKLKDFSAGHDSIYLFQDAFEGIGGLGALDVGKFHVGPHAHDKSDRVIYDNQTGALYYDADGKGGATQIKFAELDAGLKLSNANFTVSDSSIFF
jgi:Ca2+-binding RTX toxin-like protein